MNEMKAKWNSVPKWVRIICYTILGIAGAVLMGFLFGLLIQVLWNWLMPELFHLQKITYWQGIGIFLLAKILFGSIGGGDNQPKSRKTATKEPDVNDQKKNKEDWKSWKYYDEWWEQEGKTAFNTYSEKRRDEKTDLD